MALMYPVLNVVVKDHYVTLSYNTKDVCHHLMHKQQGNA